MAREHCFGVKITIYIHKYFKVWFNKYEKDRLDLGWVSFEWRKLYLD